MGALPLRARKAILPAGILGLLAGLAGCGNEAAVAPPGPGPDTVKTDTAKGDSVPGRKGMARLAAAMPRIPVPMGTRYFSAPARKTAAAAACRGEMDIFAIPSNPRGIMGIDTVTYLDSSGAAHCTHQDPTIREDHARSLFDPACGEAWETIRIEITQDDLLPRYHSRGTGRIRLVSGLEAEIREYDVSMAMDNSTGTPIFQDARLRLAASDGHILVLGLVRAHPFRAEDFFPSWDDSPAGQPIMGGPVLAGKDTVGHATLYADRSLSFLDASGKPVTPE